MKKTIISTLFILILIITFLSCTKENPTKPILQKVEEITIANTENWDEWCFGREYYDLRKSCSYIYLNNQKKFSIDIYDISNKVLYKTLKISNTGQELGVFIQNFDSIFVFDRKNLRLYLIDTSAQIKNKWELTKALADNNSLYDAYSLWSTPMYYNKNLLLLNIGGGNTVPEYYANNCLLIYNLIDNSFYKTVKFPKIYQQGKDYLKYFATHCLADSMLIYSFEIDHNIYIYNLDGNLRKKIHCKSNYLNNFENADTSKTHFHEYNSKFMIENGEYFNIIYDKYQQLFYRIVRHNMSMVDSNGKVYDDIDGKWSIIIMDKNFNILTEQVFPEKIYNIYNIIPTKEGLLISTYNRKNPKYNKYIYSFDVFKIKN